MDSQSEHPAFIPYFNSLNIPDIISIKYLGSVKLPFREFSGGEKEEKKKRGLDYHRSSVCDIPFICTLTWKEWGKQV